MVRRAKKRKRSSPYPLCMQAVQHGIVSFNPAQHFTVVNYYHEWIGFNEIQDCKSSFNIYLTSINSISDY